jgi:hypothetical protein
MIELKLPSQSHPRPSRPAELTTFPSDSIGTIATQTPDYISYLFLFVMGCVVGYAVSAFQASKFEQDRQQNDDQQQVEPDKQTDTKRIEANGAFFVFIYEFQTKTVEQEMLLRDLPAWSEINKCKFRTIDQDSQNAAVYKTAAEKVGISSPFLAVVRDNKIIRVVEFPRDRQALERLVK